MIAIAASGITHAFWSACRPVGGTFDFDSSNSADAAR